MQTLQLVLSWPPELQCANAVLCVHESDRERLSGANLFKSSILGSFHGVVLGPATESQRARTRKARNTDTDTVSRFNAEAEHVFELVLEHLHQRVARPEFQVCMVPQPALVVLETPGRQRGGCIATIGITQ